MKRVQRLGNHSGVHGGSHADDRPAARATVDVEPRSADNQAFRNTGTPGLTEIANGVGEGVRATMANAATWCSEATRQSL